MEQVIIKKTDSKILIVKQVFDENYNLIEQKEIDFNSLSEKEKNTINSLLNA